MQFWFEGSLDACVFLFKALLLRPSPEHKNTKAQLRPGPKGHELTMTSWII